MTKEFSLIRNEFCCIVTDSGFTGSICYDFSTGEIRSNKPENMDNASWLLCCRKFIAICIKMNAPFLD